MTTEQRKLINQLKAQWWAASDKAEITYPCGNGRAYQSSPQQRAAATRAFSRMLRAYREAGITEKDMIAELSQEADRRAGLAVARQEADQSAIEAATR